MKANSFVVTEHVQLSFRNTSRKILFNLSHPMILSIMVMKCLKEIHNSNGTIKSELMSLIGKQLVQILRLKRV